MSFEDKLYDAYEEGVEETRRQVVNKLVREQGMSRTEAEAFVVNLHEYAEDEEDTNWSGGLKKMTF